jgi:hypothetical protein
MNTTTTLTGLQRAIAALQTLPPAHEAFSVYGIEISAFEAGCTPLITLSPDYFAAAFSGLTARVVPMSTGATLIYIQIEASGCLFSTAIEIEQVLPEAPPAYPEHYTVPHPAVPSILCGGAA